MQRPCERENRAGTSIETRANVSMRRNIAHITSNRNDLQKKKKKENRIPLAVCVSLKFDRCPARNQSPREISKRGPACLYLHVKGSQEPSPLLSEGSKKFVDCTRVICASTSTKWLSQPFFQASRVSPSVRSPPSIFPFRGRRGEESFPSEGAVSSTGVCDARREPRPLLSRKRLEIVFRRRQGSNNWSDRKGKGPISNDHPRGNLTFVSSGSIVLLPLDTQTGWLCTLFRANSFGCFSTLRGRERRERVFFGAWREIFFWRSRLLFLLPLLHRWTILSLKFKWRKSTWEGKKRKSRRGWSSYSIHRSLSLPSFAFLPLKNVGTSFAMGTPLEIHFYFVVSPFLYRPLRNTNGVKSLPPEGNDSNSGRGRLQRKYRADRRRTDRRDIRSYPRWNNLAP